MSSTLAAPIIIPIRNPFCGKPKRSIDTNTPIELQSETESLNIFYTVDGSKPNPRSLSVVSTYGTTLKYNRPFCLKPGKQTIKAVAVNEHYESSTVTKVFLVEWVEPPCLGNVDGRRASEGYMEKVSQTEQIEALPKEKLHHPRPKSAMDIARQPESSPNTLPAEDVNR